MEMGCKGNQKLFYRTLKSLWADEQPSTQNKKGEIINDKKEVMERRWEYYKVLLNQPTEIYERYILSESGRLLTYSGKPCILYDFQFCFGVGRNLTHSKLPFGSYFIFQICHFLP